jgi:NADH-quinone oxidoreductase subunit G
MCTRCIRFCDEITKTSELGMLNRGDQSVIAVSPGRELDNPLSGTVVDLCPVGALTHREWRFNTRIWFTKQTDSICPGCSTGCSVKVAERDGQVVLVKARRNDAVNKEWLCDEGRYGFGRFLPQSRITEPYTVSDSGFQPCQLADSLNAIKGNVKTLTVLASPDLLLEEFFILKQLLARTSSLGRVTVAYRGRELSEVEKILVSPDYSSNFRGAQLAGLVGEDPESEYDEMLGKIRRQEIEHVLILGDRAVAQQDIDAALISGLKAAKTSVALLTNRESPLLAGVKMVVPGRSILEKSGLLVNRALRLQHAQAVVPLKDGTVPEWRYLALLAEAAGAKVVPANVQQMSDRDLTRWYLTADSLVSSLGLSIASLKDGGFQLTPSQREPAVAFTGEEAGASPAV